MKKRVIMAVALAAGSCSTAMVAESKIVRLPRPVYAQAATQAQPEELIDLEMLEGLTRKSFGQLMQEKHADELSYIVARVVTRGLSGDTIEYYNAHDLNKLFGGYPLKSAAPSYSYKIPHNGFAIQQVDYFIINSPDDAAFTYLCSYYDVIIDPAKKGALKELFYANQTENPKLHIKSQMRIAVDQDVDAILSSRAKMRLGEIYFEGRYGVPKDYDRASEYLEDLVEDAQVDSAFLIRAHGILGQIYYSGEYGLDKDYGNACRSLAWLLSNEDNASVRITMQLQLGTMYYRGGHGLAADYGRARDYFEQVANQTINAAARVQAYYRLGQIHYRGQGMAKDYERATHYLEYVAQQQTVAVLVPDALLLLGEISYFGGHGVKQDLNLAARSYEKAADCSENAAISARANYWLAEMHYFGKTADDSVSYPEAHRLWLAVATQRANPAVAARAKYWLGTLYHEGKGVSKNNRIALRYLKEAAQQEVDPWASAEARTWLASLYYQGDGLIRDYRQASLHWDYVAQRRDNPAACVDAMLGLGEIYCVGGYGVCKDHNRARRYLERVLEQEDAESENAVKAREWLSQIRSSCIAQ